MNLGDNVITKKMGPPIMGTIIGIMTAKLYLGLVKVSPMHWSEYYPDWPEKDIVVLELPEKSRVITFDEFNIVSEKKHGHKMTYEEYETISQKYKYMAHPIEDVELL